VEDLYPLVSASGPGAAAAGRDILGDVYTGPVLQRRAPTVWPHRVGVVPPLADGYQPRMVTAALRDGLAPGRTTVLTQVLTGLGGIGKTQLAAAHVEECWEQRELDLLIWVTASSRESIVAGYAQACWDVADPPEGETPQDRATRLLAWLAGTDKRWMVVLDDLNDPADLSGWWPAGPAGRVLVSTRRRDAVLGGEGRQTVEVDLFTPQEALSYLASRLGSAQLGEAAELAEDLGRLPLAIAQAASYILDRGLDCAAYRRRFAARRLAEVLPADAPADRAYQAIVATTWNMSLDAADRCPPLGLARPTLTLLALLDPNGIPADLLTTAAARAYLAGHPAGSDDVGEDVRIDDAADALRVLRRFSLASLSPEAGVDEGELAPGSGGGTVRVHALVQRVVREALSPEELLLAARAAADALLEVWPDADYLPGLALLSLSLRTNVRFLEVHCPGALGTPDAHALMFRTGRSLRSAGLVIDALAHHRRVAECCTALLGPEHPDTLTSRNNLASAYQAAGRRTDALPLFERTLTEYERLLGPEHPDTLTSRNNLASAYQAAGRRTDALPLFERTLTECERLLGPEHPDTLISRNNLASAYHDAGRPTDALALFERTLTEYERLLGPDHPDTLTSRNNLASAYQAAGRPTDALPLFERTLTEYERLLGPDHPDTLTSRKNLASAYHDAGRPTDALPLFERTLTEYERLLGPDHPDTLTSRNNLASAYHDAGRPTDALPLFERTLTEYERLLGPDHPDTLTSRNNLASAYHDAGRLTDALPLYGQTLAGAEKLYGATHPRIAIVLFRLGLVELGLGDAGAAVGYFARAAAVDEAAYGGVDQEVATDLDALAEAQLRNDDTPGAITSLRRVIDIRVKTDGPAAPSTIETRRRLAALLAP